MPITPVGPRLSQPATYSPGSGAPSSPRTRPWALGTTEARWSNGTPGSGTLWYPTERSTICASSVSNSPVPPNLPSALIAVRSSVIPSTRSVPRISVGRSQKRTVSRRLCPEADPVTGSAEGSVAPWAHLVIATRLPRTRRSDSTRLTPSPARSNAFKSASSPCTATSTPGSSPSSRSSLVVNLACAGPRRPIMWTSRTLLACSASRTGCGTSVACSSFGSRARILATSTATLPTPITATDSASRVNASAPMSGWPQYQFTKSVAA